MENCGQTNYNVQNLTFIRNNSYAQKIAFDKGQNCFFMMDYYNLLKERELDDKTDGYMVLAGERKGEENAVAKRVMGIYTKREEENCEKHVFEAASQQVDTTTETPFLGIIQVYITDYLCMKNSRQDVQHIVIDDYLEAYKEKIKECIEPVLEGDAYQIYRTITSEDFCVVIRTSKFRRIYDAALKIMGLKSEPAKKRIFFTYTNIGIELKGKEKNENGDITHFLGLHESVREKNGDINFVLRFRIENEALEEILALKSLQQNTEEDTQPVVIEDVNGMIGRYDLVVRLDMDEFMEIYPFLCLNITGYEILHSDEADFKSPLIGKLVEKMKQRIIQTINTRVIMKMYTIKECLESKHAASLLDKQDIERINDRRTNGTKLYNMFKNEYGTKFLTEKYRYDELIRMLDSLMNSYENLAYEIDTHLNWFICSQYLEELFESMITYMKHMRENQMQEAIDKFLNEFQAFVSAFDVFLRLLQGINQNTIQAPRYDISAPVDGQKFLIAYSEFIDSIHEAYRIDEWEPKGDSVCREKRRKEKTIIYPDLTIKNLELMEVFDYDRLNKPEEENTKTKLLICKIPMFEYFQRPYDLIPLVSHEICHHMLITDREKRNRYLIERIFKGVAAEAVHEIQNRFVKNGYKNRKDALTKVMSDSLSDILIKDFKHVNESWKQYVFRHLTKEIHGYIGSYFEDDGKKRNGQYDVYITKSNVKVYEKLFSELYENDESELQDFHKLIKEISDTEAKRNTINKELVKLAEIKENGNAGAEKNTVNKELEKLFEKIKKEINDLSDARYDINKKLEELTVKLLRCANKQTIKYKMDEEDEEDKEDKKAPIKLKDLLANDGLKLDYYLLWWKKYNESEILAGSHITEIEKKQLIKNYLDTVKSIFALYTDSMSVQKDKVEQQRENFADAFAIEAKRQFEKFLNEDEYYYIYDEEKLERAEFWEFKKTGNAKKHYIEAMDCIEPKKINDVIDFEIKFYREACADAAMCRWLGLNSFGYFRMSITLGLRMQGYMEQMQPGGLQRGRLVTVLAVLAKQENPDCVREKGEWTEIDLSGLQNTIWKYIEDAMSCAKERVKTAMDNDKLDEKQSVTVRDDFFAKLELTVQKIENYVLQNRKIGWKESLLDRLFKDQLDIEGVHLKYLQKEGNIFKRLYEMLDAYGRVQKNNILHVETKVLKHITGVYENMTAGKELHSVVKEVVNFYNDPCSEKKTNAQKMVDMLQFVQDYYYRNRIDKAEEELWEPGMQKA